MNAFASSLARVLAQTSKLCGDPFIVWRNLELAITPATQELTNQLAAGGFSLDIKHAVRISSAILPQFITADLTTITADSDLVTADNNTKVFVLGEKVRYQNRDYRIILVSKDGAGSHYTLGLGNSKR